MTRVFLVDDQTLVRKGIRSLLSLLPDIEIAGEAVDGREALRLIPAAAPDVVLLDIRMPEMDGLDVLRALVRPGRAPHFIILTTLDRKSTRLNSSHSSISYAVFCLKKKKNKKTT